MERRKRMDYSELREDEENKETLMDSGEQDSSRVDKAKHYGLNKAFVRLRETPEVDGKILKILTPFDRVEVISNRKFGGEYYRLRNPESGLEGYVHSKYISELPG